VEKHSERKSRSRSRGRARDNADETALVPVDGRSPIQDIHLSEKIYVDEVDMPFRPAFLPEHEDGLPTDLEIFVGGLPKKCTERDLWEHLCRLGAADVKEILLLRRQKVSKGMAYVVFNRHDHAVLAKTKLNGIPASAIPCGGKVAADEHGTLLARFSESERCINGRQCVYGTDMAGLLLGARGKMVEQVKEASGLRKVLLTGRSMRSYGEVDEDPRLHLVVYYESGEAENVTKAIKVWGEQLGLIHKELVEKAGKGMGKGARPPTPLDAAMHMRPPYYGAMDGYGHYMPPALPSIEATEEAPVFVQRRTPAASVAAEGEKDKEAASSSGPKVLEATCLRGQELRWQPWPEVGKFNEEWGVVPLRWGLRGELFVLLRRRDTGELRVCAADVHRPVEKWPVLSTRPGSSRTVKYKSFTFREHLFTIAIDRQIGSLQVYHVPDPSAPWTLAFETTLPEAGAAAGEKPDGNSDDGEDGKDGKEGKDGKDPKGQGLGITRAAKLYVFYATDRSPHVVAVNPQGEAEAAAKVFRIADPAKQWTPCAHAPALSSKARVMPVYTKTERDGATFVDVALLSVDSGTDEMSVHVMPGNDDTKPWLLLSKLPFRGDSRFCCAYVPGKPEPVLMAGSPTERVLKLCHLNLIEWSAAKKKDSQELPSTPVVEVKFSRPMGSIWPETHFNQEGQTVVATPIDCTTDLPVSRHPWIASVGPVGSDPPQQPGVAGANGSAAQDPASKPPGAAPPFDSKGPRGPTPGGAHELVPFGAPRPPMARPPFDEQRSPFDGAGPHGQRTGYPPHPHMPPLGRPPPAGYMGPPYGPAFGPPFGPPGAAPYGRPPLDPSFGRPPYGPPGWPPRGPPGWGPQPPAAAASFDTAPRATGDPAQWEVGQLVEANFRDSGQWQVARIVAKLQNQTFDIEYKGDYMEWQVHGDRLRVLSGSGQGAPAGEASGAPGMQGAPGAHSIPEPADKDDGGEKDRKHHRHRRRRHHRSEKD